MSKISIWNIDQVSVITYVSKNVGSGVITYVSKIIIGEISQIWFIGVDKIHVLPSTLIELEKQIDGKTVSQNYNSTLVDSV